MKLTKFLAGAAALMMAFTVAGCKTEEDSYINLKVSGDNASCDFTNDDTCPVNYARAFVTTATKHLSADMEIKIDTSKSSTSGSTAGYIFNLLGSGTENDPYSFCLVGIRNGSSGPQYFASYYTGVLSADTSSDANDFDTSANKAVEYALTGSNGNGWVTIPTGSYTKNSNTLTVYMDVSAMAGNIEITEENDDTYLKVADSIKVTLKDSENDTEGKEILFNLDNVNAGKDKGGKTGAELTSFPVEQAKLGYYAMVGKDKTLTATWTRSNFVLSAEPVEE